MAQDSKYVPVEYVYNSRGLAARWQIDEAPPYYYLQLMNGLEREENALSSRYGTQIINRDPINTPNGTNYYFSSPIVSLAKMNFQNQPQRFASLADGSLWQRNSNLQGPYSQIYSGLSGNPWQSVISPCYQTALPFLFIYDEAVSIKVPAGGAIPQLTGIDPPPYTANALPFSPLLTLIDNLSASNSYDASGFEDGWNYGLITNVPVGLGMVITDFPQYINLAPLRYSFTPSSAPVPAEATFFVPTATASQTYSGFSSVPVSVGEQVTATVSLTAQTEESGGGTGSGSVEFQYSTDGGNTWTTFYSWSSNVPTVFGPQPVSFAVNGLTNLDNLWFQILVTSNCTSGEGTTFTTAGSWGFASIIQASITDAGIFGQVCNGILSVLNNDSLTQVPVVSIEASGQSGDVYTTLTVITGTPHGASSGQNISIYGASNDLADGFYPATVLSPNSLTVPFLSPVGTPLNLSATAGTLQWVSPAGPNTCVITDEYSTPYPTQLSAWGFYQQASLSASNFPIGAWSGLVDTNSTATVGVSADFNLSQNNQVTDSDLIVVTLQVGSPANIANIRLQFDVNDSGYTSSYYFANIAPAYYQGNIANQISAYQTTQNQIVADALGLITGQPESSTTAQLQPSNISTGSGSWIAVLIPRGNFLPVGSAGQSGLDWTNITGWQLIFETTATAITGDGSSTVAVNGLYLQWGYGPSSFAGVGYDYRVTYYSLTTGTESSPSSEQEFNQQYGYLSSLSAPFYLRQAAQVSGYYSSDPQVTHYRVYRRGGIYPNNWLLIDQVPNITNAGQFLYKDVVPDASLAQAQPLVLDNDPPVTASLVTPILTTLSLGTSGPGQSIYSTFSPQLLTVEDDTAVFVANQTVLVGNAYNLEEVLVISGGIGQFTGIVRLQHNAGEQVQVNSVPRAKCNLCAIVNLPSGATQVIVAGDESNPHRVYYSKPGQPENFGPEDYVDSASPDDPVTALINWRGTTLVATQGTWYVWVGGAQPYLQPTGAAHGVIASQAWCFVEGEIAFLASDGWRFFSGADGKYMTLPVEWIFRGNPECLPPQASASNSSEGVFAYYNNCVYGSYISINAGQRYRLVHDTVYSRFRQDDVAATAMLWEKDTDLLICGVPVYSQGFANPQSPGNYLLGYAVVADQQYNQDYDDGGWSNTNISPDLICTSANWTNPANASSFFAALYASVPASTVGNQLIATAARISIPAGATVMGISVFFNAWGYIFNTRPVSATLVFNAIAGSTLATGAISSTPSPYSLGSNATQWGFTLTPALLNSGLSFIISGGAVHLALGGTNLNGLLVTVYYKLAGSDQLIQTPIQLNVQTPYRDLGKPHFPKNWNVLETDCNTQGQELQTTLWFDSGESAEIVLPPINTGTQRQKVQQPIDAGDGNESYSMSIQHTIAVTIAPTLFQENIYASILADYRSSFDTYWQKAGIDELKLWKEGYFDYTATAPVNFNLYMNGDMDFPYYQFSLPVQANRSVVRVLFPAMKCRLWRMVGVSTGDFQLWSPVQVDSKPLLEGSAYERVTYGVYE